MFKTHPSDPSPVTLSTQVYRLLLAFYPAKFRREYGAHMAQVFRDCCLKTFHQSGLPGMLTLWGLTLFDWFKTVVEEQFNRGTDMTRTKFIRLSGWGMILAPVSLLLTFLSEDQIQRGVYRLFGAPATASGYDRIQSLNLVARHLPFFFAILLITVGLLGLHARYARRIGNLGTLALGVGVVGGVAALGINTGMAMGYEDVHQLMSISMTFMFGGLFVFGLTALQKKLMLRGNGFPALAGFWWPFIFFGTNLYHQVTGQWLNIPSGIFFTLFLAMGISLAFLGYALQADAPHYHEIHLL